MNLPVQMMRRLTVCVSGLVGRAGWALDRKAPQAGTLLENAARTHHPLHAVLGARMEQHAEPAAHFTLPCF
jgi:hypothetical protein